MVQAGSDGLAAGEMSPVNRSPAVRGMGNSFLPKHVISNGRRWRTGNSYFGGRRKQSMGAACMVLVSSGCLEPLLSHLVGLAPSMPPRAEEVTCNIAQYGPQIRNIEGSLRKVAQFLTALFQILFLYHIFARCAVFCISAAGIALLTGPGAHLANKERVPYRRTIHLEVEFKPHRVKKASKNSEKCEE